MYPRAVPAGGRAGPPPEGRTGIRIAAVVLAVLLALPAAVSIPASAKEPKPKFGDIGGTCYTGVSQDREACRQAIREQGHPVPPECELCQHHHGPEISGRADGLRTCIWKRPHRAGERTNMQIGNRVIAAFATVSALLFVASPATAEDFGWIMASIAAQGAVDNGDGHDWIFRPTDDGKWEVEGAMGNTADVTSAGENRISIDGFPDHWGANGIYAFAKTGGTCSLKSESSATHRLQWPCGGPKPTRAPDNATAADDAAPPPGLGKRGRKRWERYLAAGDHKAFARGAGRRFGWAAKRGSVEEAKKAAMRDCEKKGDTCRIVSVDGKSVQ